MVLRIHDTYRRGKVDFVPHDPAHVRMYVCGPTVYDYAHIGNARPVVVFDVLYRLLKRLYPKVTYVRNITDIDDKINARAAESGEPIGEITKRTAAQFHEDVAAIGALPPDVEPRATEHVELMVGMIGDLIAKGHAYVAEGPVLFDVPSWPAYGRLSRHSRDELVAGARVEIAPYKKDPADFVLWKPSGPELPGWESPWGRGRPGWHIECSAMSTKYLGATFDIHGGGQDLIFPHHENEIAQCLCEAPVEGFARYWMHNGYLMAEGEKMSKSLGNFYTINELLQEYPGEAIRLLLLQTHYRQPLDFTKDGLQEAKRILDRWYRALREASQIVEGGWQAICGQADSDEIDEQVTSALSNDLNTPEAITILHHLVESVFAATKASPNAAHDSAFDRENLVFGDALALIASANLLGLLQSDPEDWFKWHPTDTTALDSSAVDALIAERAAARRAKDFATSDRIRDELAEQGILLEDKPDGTIWRRA